MSIKDQYKPLLEYSMEDAMEIADNPYQGDYKRVLCVCSAGILRSATAAVVLSRPPFNFNTRTVGVEYYALVPITEPLLYWAQEIVCMTEKHKEKVQKILLGSSVSKKIICLNIKDSYEYREKALEVLIKERYTLLS